MRRNAYQIQFAWFDDGVGMMDRETRSRMMSRVRSRNTTPEIRVSQALTSLGIEHEKHPELPGTPDILIPSLGLVIFVHGCFWHLHTGCRKATIPTTRREFWRKKLESNVQRDESVRARLEAAGWRTAVIWECETKKRDSLEAALLGIIEPPKGILDVVKILSVTEASRLSGLTPQHLRRLVKEGKIDGRLAGGVWLLDESSLKRYLAKPRRSGRPPKQVGKL